MKMKSSWFVVIDYPILVSSLFSLLISLLVSPLSSLLLSSSLLSLLSSLYPLSPLSPLSLFSLRVNFKTIINLVLEWSLLLIQIIREKIERRMKREKKIEKIGDGKERRR
jgi:hypothetical protein